MKVLRFVSWAVAGIGLAVMNLLIESMPHRARTPDQQTPVRPATHTFGLPWTVIFLPIWLLWLACVLRRISAQVLGLGCR